MADRIYIIPRRTDLDNMNLQVTDLWPNTSQRNSSIDPPGQSCYIGACLQTAGLTQTDVNSWKGGSKNTLLRNAIDAIIAMDTTGGGNDVQATPTPTFGLSSYLRERVHAGGILAAAAAPFTVAQAITAANAITALVEAGSALTLAGINTVLSAVVAGTDLNGAAGFSKSFGAVEEVLRILSGEVYSVPRYTIITNVAGQFRSLGERTTLVANQLSLVTGKTFGAQGHMLDTDEPGYVGRPVLTLAGYSTGSLFNGQLAANKLPRILLNPQFAYHAADVTAEHLRARDIAGNAIDPSGSHAVLAVYSKTGTVL